MGRIIDICNAAIALGRTVRSPVHKPFRSRPEAGQALAAKLGMYAGRGDILVLGLPRGGVPVAYEIARALGAPLDVFLVRKLGVPGNEELAMGAIASGGVRVLNDEVIHSMGISPSAFAAVARREQDELARRERLYRGARPLPPLAGRVAILVDDGLATGSTMGAAVEAVRRLAPSRLVIAAPVGARETCEEFRARVDEVVCLITPQRFLAVGAWYDDFSQTSDDEVRQLLDRAAGETFDTADAPAL